MVREALIGAAAGAVGTVALDVVTYGDMALRGRPASSTPSQVVGALADKAGIKLVAGDEEQADEKVKNRQSGLGALLGYATGIGIGAVYGLIQPRVQHPPVLGAAIGIGLAAMAASDVPATALGVTKPTTWGVEGWASDLVPHLVYGLVTVATYDAFAGQQARSTVYQLEDESAVGRESRTMAGKGRKVAVKQLGAKIEGIPVAMLTTAMEDGTLRSRPMATQDRDFDGDLWFFTQAAAPKVGEVEEHQQVNLSYAAPDDSRYVSVSGTAELVRDRQKMEELWRPRYKAWFPKGLDDPELALLRVHVDNAEYWDTAPSSIGRLAGIARAALTRKVDQAGQSKKLAIA